MMWGNCGTGFNQIVYYIVIRPVCLFHPIYKTASEAVIYKLKTI
jgi:hypothetical protein